MWIASLLAAAVLHAAAPRAAQAPEQFVVVNIAHSPRAEVFEAVARAFPAAPGARRRVGVAGIFSYLHHPREAMRADLEQFLRLAEHHDVPIVVQLDGEQWWGARPDLWNWWDPAQPGYDRRNRANVEWTGWGPEHAIRIAWRNWGRQIRVLPPPNLMSPAYQRAWREEMRRLVPLVMRWWRGLPEERRWLLIGIKVGWESSVGVNAWHYPGGARLAERPAEEDPTTGLRTDELPARGVEGIGYAAAWTARIRRSGNLTEADLAEVARRHLEELSRWAARLGVPRDRLFTHGAGWKEGELLYDAAVNRYASPGWSFYRHAANPMADTGVRRALARSDAPWWAAVEWLYQGPDSVEAWRAALETTLADPRCRYLCIYNWEGIRENRAALDAIRLATGATPLSATPGGPSGGGSR